MTSKSRDFGNSPESWSYSNFNANGTFSNSTTGSYTVSNGEESITYTNIPHYYSRKAKGELLPINWCTHIKTQQTARPPGFFEFRRLNGTSASGDFNNDPSNTTRVGTGIYHGSSWQITDYDYLVTSAFANAKADAWDVLTFIAEAKESLDMIAHAAPRLSGLVMQLAGRARSSKSRLDAFQNLWLESRYGWRPLVGDIQDARSALERLSETFKRSRGYSSFDTTETWVDYHAVAPTADGILPQWTIETNIRRQVWGSAIIDIIPNHQSFGFDPAVTAWEVVPYSFVLDWVANVGDAIAAWSPSLHLKGAVTGISIKETAETVVRMTGISKGANIASASGQIGDSSTTVETYIRRPMAAPSFPQLRLKLDLLKAIDGIFLLRGLKARTLNRLFN